MGPQGSGGTLKMPYSAEEMLKASVSNEGRMNVLLWYRLVGAYVGLFPGFAPGVSGCAWYGGDSPHLAVGPSVLAALCCAGPGSRLLAGVARSEVLCNSCGVGSCNSSGLRGETRPSRCRVRQRKSAVNRQGWCKRSKFSQGQR